MASPFPLAQPEDEQSVIKPAVEGTLSKWIFIIIYLMILIKYFNY